MKGSKGTRLINLRDATLSAGSSDAVTGRQIYATNQNIAGFAADIKSNANTISDLAKSVTNTLDSVSSMSESFSSINSLKADVSLNNLSDAGKQRKLTQCKAPEVVLTLLQEAREAGVPAQHVLFDSRFCSPASLHQIHELGYDVIPDDR